MSYFPINTALHQSAVNWFVLKPLWEGGSRVLEGKAYDLSKLALSTIYQCGVYWSSGYLAGIAASHLMLHLCHAFALHAQHPTLQVVALAVQILFSIPLSNMANRLTEKVLGIIEVDTAYLIPPKGWRAAAANR